jgi:cation:H+ antiporter
MKVNVRVLGRDVAFFVVGYAVAIGTAFLPPEIAWLKWVAAAFLIILYAVYVRLHFTDEPEGGDPAELNRLHITRVTGGVGKSPPDDLEVDAFPGDVTIFGHEPPMSLIVVQVIVALGLIIVGAQVFVGAVEQLSTQIGLDPTILALIIAPIATELPEKFNSVLWVRNGKDTLAMGNITGAMVFQSCLPTVLGLLFTTWTFTGDSAISFASAGVAILATLIIFGNMLRTGRLSAWSLLIGGPLYLVYVYVALFTPLGAGAGGH